MEAIYFQSKGINPKYCEVGMILENNKDYIHYLDEPCKILISEVKIIDKENVYYNNKQRLYCVKDISKITGESPIIEAIKRAAKINN